MDFIIRTGAKSTGFCPLHHCFYLNAIVAENRNMSVQPSSLKLCIITKRVFVPNASESSVNLYYFCNFQLCSSETGRSYLRSIGAYFVLRELHLFECALEAKSKDDKRQQQRRLILAIENVVDQLICEENERPKGMPESLRHVHINEKMDCQLNEATANYLKD